jgi:hypothetical protein
MDFEVTGDPGGKGRINLAAVLGTKQPPAFNHGCLELCFLLKRLKLLFHLFFG